MKVIVQLVFAFRGNDHRKDFISFGAEIDAVQPAVTGRDLVLPSAGLVTECTFEIDRIIRQLLLGSVFAFQRVKCIDHADGKRTGCAKTAPCRQIRFVVQADLMHVHHLHGVFDGGMQDLVDGFHPLDPRIGKLRRIIEKPRQVAYIDIAVFVDGR